MQESEDDNRQFEQVLSRLDALMKRSQATAAEAPSPPVAQAQDRPLPTDDSIPLLTEVYDGSPEVSPAARARQALAGELVEELMPDLRQVIARVLEEEMVRVRNEIAARLALDVAAALQQRLLREDQTDI